MCVLIKSSISAVRTQIIGMPSTKISTATALFYHRYYRETQTRKRHLKTTIFKFYVQNCFFICFCWGFFLLCFQWWQDLWNEQGLQKRKKERRKKNVVVWYRLEMWFKNMPYSKPNQTKPNQTQGRSLLPCKLKDIVFEYSLIWCTKYHTVINC